MRRVDRVILNADREAELDLRVQVIKELVRSISSNYWRLGRELSDCFSRKLYKARGKYKSWDQFSEAEIGLSGNQTRTIIAVSERFTEEQVSRFGVEKLKYVAKAPAAQQPRLLAEADKLSSRELAEKVKGGRRSTSTSTRAVALASGSAAAKAARDASAVPARSESDILGEVRDAFWSMNGPTFADWLEARVVSTGGAARPKAAE